MKMIGLQAILSWFSTGCAEQREVDDALLEKFEARVFEEPAYSHPLPFRLYIPPSYDGRVSFPLVLYLHSSGGRGTDNKTQLEFPASVLVSESVQDLEQSFVLAPQCPSGTQWLNTSFDRMPFTNYRQEEIPESDAMKMVVRVLAALLSEFNIDAKRIYVMGVSMGASGTWDIITRHPDLFTAAVTASGVSDPSSAHLLSQVPVWAFHGARDEVSSVENTRRMMRELRKHGSVSRFTEFEDLGHNITRPTLEHEGLFEWLFDQERKHDD